MTSAWAGIWIAEDIELLAAGIDDGSWIDGTIGTAGLGLDTLALVVDPGGVLLQYGAAWMIEHVEPLTEALDWLAGDPAAIAGNADTWRTVAADLATQAAEIERSVRAELPEWQGAAAEDYRAWSADQQGALSALSRAAETLASITEGAGTLVATVRLMVRDAIATVVSRLIVYAAEELASFGAATPVVVDQVTALVGSWAARIARWLRALIQSFRNLAPIIRRLSDLIEELHRLLNRLRRGPDEPIALHRAQKRGAGRVQLFRMETVRDIAAKYGIDLTGLDISLGSKSSRGVDGRTYPDGRIVLYPQGFRSEEDLARTLVHEKFHHDELAAGKPFPWTEEAREAYEDRAYAHEKQWWNDQPVRPERRR